jgi:hypothetical protein
LKTLTITKYLFTLIGAALLASAFSLYNGTTSFLKEAVSTEGTVVELVPSRSSNATTYAPVVQFNEINGRLVEFTSNASSNPPAYNRGERVVVLYSPNTPESAKIDGFFSVWGGTFIVAILGLLFGALGGGLLAYSVSKERSKSSLMKTGVEIQAAFQGVEHNTSLRVNGHSPFQILCQWQHPHTGEMHLFRSDNLWFDPSDYIKLQTLPVRVNEANPKKYWVDTSFLPKLAS